MSIPERKRPANCLADEASRKETKEKISKEYRILSHVNVLDRIIGRRP